mmetsp:Transcript_28471/g.90736  ORF Transcript_28471/g.90736 Transcript_28471/m.90736 type:complete len:239 (+) Transcript_28471:307-1023(+)
MPFASASASLTEASALIFVLLAEASASATVASARMRMALASPSAFTRVRAASASARTCCARVSASAWAISASACVLRVAAAARAWMAWSCASRSCCCVAICVWPARFAICDSVCAVVTACCEMELARPSSMILNCSMRMLEMSRPYFSLKSSWSLARNWSCALSKKRGAEGWPVACARACSSWCAFSEIAEGRELCAMSLSTVDLMMFVSVAIEVSMTSSGMSSRPTCVMAFSGSEIL